MLSIFYGDMPEAIYNPALFFKNTYEDSWITDPFCQKMIQDVDRSKVIAPRVIDSPVLGAITPRELSGGVKTLIAIYKRPDLVFNASACGDNCAKWMLAMCGKEDRTINLYHLMGNDRDDPFVPFSKQPAAPRREAFSCWQRGNTNVDTKRNKSQIVLIILRERVKSVIHRGLSSASDG